MKKTLFILIMILMLILTGCSGSKTVKTKDETKKLSEEFYNDLLNEENISMTSYYNGEKTSVFKKDGDKMYVDNGMYDYYLFMKDGKKYLIADDRTLFEDEAMYDMSLDTIPLVLQMQILGYFDIEDDSLSFEASNKDNELVTTIKGKSDGVDFTVTTTGKKQEDKVTNISSETKIDDTTYSTQFDFTYGDIIELPEYKEIKTYDNMPHVDSPYETFGQIYDKYTEDDYIAPMMYDNELFEIGEVDGRHYQFSSILDQEIVDKYFELDFSSEDYETQVYNLLKDIEIQDCIDFTDEILNSEQLNTYMGKKVEDLISEDFEVNGYSFFEDHNYIYASKDYMTYQLSVEIPDGFDTDSDFDYEDLNEFIIKEMIFSNIEYAALPMR